MIEPEFHVGWYKAYKVVGIDTGTRMLLKAIKIGVPVVRIPDPADPENVVFARIGESIPETEETGTIREWLEAHSA